MTVREQADLVLPELFVIVSSAADATALAPLAHRDPEIRPVLVATGPDPMAVDEVLDDLGALAGRVLLMDRPGVGPAAEAAALLPRMDALLADDRPAAVLVRGGSPTALAATQAAVWRDVPVVGVPVDGGSRVEVANQAAVAALVATQDARRVPPDEVRSAAAAQRLVRERLAPAGGTRVLRLPTDRSRSGLSA